MLLALGLALQIGLIAPYWVDRSYLTQEALAARVPVELVLAVAWQESRGNLDPKLRGHHCWHGLQTLADGTIAGAVHLPDCEVGRMQVKPSTARTRCKGLNIWVYSGNIKCGVKILGEDIRKYGAMRAVEKYNGSGPLARKYKEAILETVGWLTLTKTKEGL